jgi:hypothetical protein
MIGRVTRLRAEQDVDANRRRLYRQIVQKLRHWKEHGTPIVGMDPDTLAESDLIAMRPRMVEWIPWGSWFCCEDATCGIMHNLRERGFNGSCRLCGKALRQLHYVYYHDCGALAELCPTNHDACQEHGLEYLAFVDTRQLPTSYWQCRKCTHRRTCFYPYCHYAQCRTIKTTEKKYSIAHWRDNWVYYPQTIEFVNLDEQRVQSLLRNDRGKALVHQAVIGEIPAGGSRLTRLFDAIDVQCAHCQLRIPPASKFCPECGKPQPNPIDTEAVGYPLGPDDGRMSFAVLRDLDQSSSLKELAQGADGTEKLTTEFSAAERVGIADIVLVQEFPLTSAAFGYTRDRAGAEVWLRAFDKRGEHNVAYTNSVGTEGWLVQLRGKCAIRWLHANDIHIDGMPADGASEQECKLWLLEHLALQDPLLIAVIPPMIHTFAHAMLLSLAVSCGLEASSLGELLLTDALAFALYAGDSELGSLTAAFEQGLPAVIAGISDYMTCKFDPGCSADEGGACVGCLHLARGCTSFNEQLSRAYLYGGSTGNGDLLAVSAGFLAPSFTAP